jgi:hypothetical protein
MDRAIVRFSQSTLLSLRRNQSLFDLRSHVKGNHQLRMIVVTYEIGDRDGRSVDLPIYHSKNNVALACFSHITVLRSSSDDLKIRGMSWILLNPVYGCLIGGIPFKY